jgi:hypothetical protein
MVQSQSRVTKVAFFASFLALIFSAAAPQAQAQPCLSVAAVTCTPAATDVQGNRLVQAISGVRHSTNATGSISLFCPVFNNFDGGSNAPFNILFVRYADPNGPVTTGSVQAQLRFVEPGGAVATKATFNSNSFPSTLGAERSAPISPGFNFRSNGYVLQVTIFRSSTATAPVFRSFSVCRV